MAHARNVIVLGLVLVGAAAHAASGPCDEGRDAAGLAVVVRDGAVVVQDVTPGSPAATSGVRAGDVVLQVNGAVPTSCAEWSRAVRDARDGRKALLLLVGRGDGETPLALGRRTWGGAEPTEIARPAAPPAPRPRVEPALPPPLPAEVPVSVGSVVADLGALVGRTREGLDPYRDAVTSARRGVETLAVRKLAPPETVTELRRVAHLHETAVLAWQAVDEIRERNGIARRLPVSEALSAPYFSGSPVESAIDEFDFLRETVVTEPHGGRVAESSGEWRPAAARRLVWEHGGESLGRVAATLAAAP